MDVRIILILIGIFIIIGLMHFLFNLVEVGLMIAITLLIALIIIKTGYLKEVKE